MTANVPMQDFDPVQCNTHVGRTSGSRVIAIYIPFGCGCPYNFEHSAPWPKVLHGQQYSSRFVVDNRVGRLFGCKELKIRVSTATTRQSPIPHSFSVRLAVNQWHYLA
ncbi:hypothetical protein H310_12030 [Aphanomyces invadans]|uniref:Uncharacterized protein n=1 Tax=Aphanomyces invadans TaxID=157072 RepID=A0A024TM72_9STRA|nr:hypothetical protein H310_12030 [Aphanomyces invadans]ETV94397.1 hypothetical protein H310_12030 [Aphanomyces invadans]|eukprot:XP_008877159.1 hypothetical protein H310_12030 [Aphanomyces invadans]